MKNLWVIVKHFANAVATELTHDTETIRFGMTLNGGANIAQTSAGFNRFNAEIHALLGNFGQALGEHAGFTGEEHLTGITVIAIFDDSDVNVDCITTFQNFGRAWNTVTNHMID